MEINSAFSSGLYGLNQASQQITESSEKIANHPVNSENTENSSYDSQPVTAELINMKLAEIQAQASAKVITTADEMVGSLIDVSV